MAGSRGGLKLVDVDTTGGKLAQTANGIIGGGMVQKPNLEFYG